MDSIIPIEITPIALTIIFIIMLKNKAPITLAIVLSIILGVLSYYKMDKIPYYLLPLLGISIYIIRTLVTFNKTDGLNLGNNIWEAPFWGILMYYIILYMSQKIE